jgi:hypothetical protein
VYHFPMPVSAEDPNENQSPSTLERAEGAERLRDYFDLQLRFAEAVAAAAALPFSDTVRRYTNFYRRFGLASLRGAPIAPEWNGYIAYLVTLETQEQRVAWTQTFFAQSPPDSPLSGERQFGCCRYDPPDAEGVVRIHSANRDNDGVSPLDRSKIERRKKELTAMFTHVRKTHADAREVRGRSWLLNLEAHNRLLPPAYCATREVLKADIGFQGSSTWGQFLDHRGNVKPAMRERFLENLGRLDPNRLWEVFPLPPCRAHAPIQVFYEFYDIA